MEERRLYRSFWVAGREFRVYYEYFSEMEHSYPVYPDFVSSPQYTEDGRPFAHFVQEGCPGGICREDGSPEPENCGLCQYFSREAPDAPIGVCTNEYLRKTGQGGS
ncbi:MAG: hypothetical protein Q4B42_05195 [Oscillospiraceae bacterium]|nr:hypothetical protein [Oscillospiraceae bacterium]